MIGRQIRSIRKRSGLNQEQFARRIGCTLNYVSMIETGTANNPSDSIISKICEEFDCELMLVPTEQEELIKKLKIIVEKI